MCNVLSFCAETGFFRWNYRFSTKSILLSPFRTLSKILRKSETLESSFKLFSDSLNMKILPSIWLFELVKVNEQSSLQYKFTPFPGLNWTNYEKGIRWLIMVNRVLSCIILSFFRPEGLNLRKTTTNPYLIFFRSIYRRNEEVE